MAPRGGRPNPARDGYRSPVHHPPASNRSKIYACVLSVVLVVAYFAFMSGGEGPSSDIDNEWASVYPDPTNPSNLRGSSNDAPPNMESIVTQEPTTQDQEPSVSEETTTGFDEYDKETLEEEEREKESAAEIAKMEIEELVEENEVIDTEISIEEKIDQSKPTIEAELQDILKDLDIPSEKKTDNFISQLTERIIENLKDEVDQEIVTSGHAIMEEKEEEIDEVVEEDEMFGADAEEEISDIEEVVQEAREEIQEDFEELKENMESTLEGRTDEMVESVLKEETGVNVDVKKMKKNKQKKHDNEQIDDSVIAAKLTMEEYEAEEVVMAESEIDALLEQKRTKIETELVELFDHTLAADEVEKIVTRIVEKVRKDADDTLEQVGAAALEDKEAEMDRAIEDDKQGDFFTQNQILDEIDEIEVETIERVEADVEGTEKELEDHLDEKLDSELKKEIVAQAQKKTSKKESSTTKKESSKTKKESEEIEEQMEDESEETEDEE